MSAKTRRSGAQGVALQDAIDILCGADYEIGSAANVLENCGLEAEAAEADVLMRACIALREKWATARKSEAA